MVNNGKTCAENVNYNNKCRHKDRWVTNKYCQQSCFDNGAGYDGDDCSTPAPTSGPTAAPTSAPMQCHESFMCMLTPQRSYFSSHSNGCSHGCSYSL